MSGLDPFLAEKITPGDLSCPIGSLPSETLVHIFKFLPCKDVAACSQTCQRWASIIHHSSCIWRNLCATLTNCRISVEKDRAIGYSWQEAFKRNYGANGVKRLWKQGLFSNVQGYDQLPGITFCHMDTNSWGQILQWELER